jgi:acyl carrier protein
MTDAQILDRVQAIVDEVARQDRRPERAGPNTPLGESGYWLDSLDMLEVILACEREFGIIFEEGTDLTADTMLSARGLAAVIRTRITA